MSGREETKTGGRPATTGVIAGRYALSVGNPQTPLPRGWRWTPITEVARLETGHTPSRRHPEYWDGGVPWIGIKDATGNHGRTIHDTYQHASPLGIENSSARLLPVNTVCLSRTASVGYVVVMGQAMATSQDFVNWVCSDALDYRYLKYVLLAEHDAFLMFASGTTHQTIYFPEVKAFHLALPPARDQREIADILSALDDKIELNRRMSETLESMARALFSSWLNHERPSRVPTADLIADGVLEIGDGYRAKNDELGSPGLPFIRAGDLQAGIQTHGAEVLRRTSADKAGNKVSRAGDVAFTSKGTIGRFARVSRHTAPCVYSPQVCYWRSLNAAALHPGVLYAWMTSADLASQIEAVSGQTDMALYVSLSDQRRMEMPCFPSSQSQIGASLAALYSRQDSANAESQVLASIRDALLPKLISGELRLKPQSGGTAFVRG